jgi:hypothetical protein
LASDSTAVIKNLKGGRTGREAFESVWVHPRESQIQRRSS